MVNNIRRVAALKELRDMAPNVPIPYKGICGNVLDITDYCGGFSRGIKAWIQSQQETEVEVDDGWLRLYPVEGGNSAAYDAQENKWVGEYAERRMALLDFLIAYYAEVDTGKVADYVR